MRRLPSLLALPVLVPALLAAPALPVRPPSPPAASVPPHVQSLPLPVPEAAQARAPGAPKAGAGQLVPLVATEERDTAPFSALGLSWAADRPTSPVHGLVRVRSGGTWSDWQQVEPEDAAPDPDSLDATARPRRGSSMLWVGRADGVQVRVEGEDDHRPRDLRLLLVDPGRSPRDRALGGGPAGPTAQAAAEPVAPPPIFSREDWGADESMRSLNGEECAKPAYGRTVRMGFVHHTVNRNDYAPEESAAIVRAIYALHVQGNGWCDIGYSFLVDRFGRVFEGRAGGIDRPVIGAHTYGFNTNTFAVSMIGDFTRERPSAAALAAVTRVLAWKLQSYYRDPAGQAVMVTLSADRFQAGQPVAFNVISAHRDANYTECPGDAGYATLPQLRSAVQTAIGDTSTPIQLRWKFLGAGESWLGEPFVGEGAIAGGRGTWFEHGAMFWSPNTGVWAVRGAILERYAELDGPESALGFPIDDEEEVPGGRMSAFQSGAVYWSRTSGAWELTGPILAHWRELGATVSLLGFPISSEREVRGGTAQDFQRGAMFSSGATGAHEVHGAILRAYRKLGGPDSLLGLPTSDEYAVPLGRRSDFQRGSLVWLAATGTVLLLPLPGLPATLV